MDRRTRRKLRRIWEYIKVFSVTLFAMAAGAASYHQYLVQNDMIGQQERIVFCHPAAVQGKAEPEQIQIVEELEVIKEPEIIEGLGITQDELELMALCVEAEAGNQELNGKRMVADVILNRVDDPDFPDTIEGVITQPYHFSSYWDGGMERVGEPSEETIRAVEMELEERGWPGLLYFTAGNWPEYGTPWRKVGDHYFNTK